MEEYVKRKRDIYRRYSRTYDEDRRTMVGQGPLSQRIQWALSGLSVGQRLLDLGCGTGDLLVGASTVIGESGRACGMDISSDMLKIAKRKLSGPPVALIEGNVADRLPFLNHAFDRVVSLNLFQEISPDSYLAVLEEAFRVLEPGGQFRAAVPCLLGNGKAEAAFSRAAERRAAMYFRSWNEIESVFSNSVFGDVETTLKLSNAARVQVDGEPKFDLFAQFMADVREEGLDPSRIQQAVLLVSATAPSL